MKSLLQTINEGKESQFSLTELDQKIILAMVEYFYDNSQAKALLIKNQMLIVILISDLVQMI